MSIDVRIISLNTPTRITGVVIINLTVANFFMKYSRLEVHVI